MYSPHILLFLLSFFLSIRCCSTAAAVGQDARGKYPPEMETEFELLCYIVNSDPPLPDRTRCSAQLYDFLSKWWAVSITSSGHYTNCSAYGSMWNVFKTSGASSQVLTNYCNDPVLSFFHGILYLYLYFILILKSGQCVLAVLRLYTPCTYLGRDCSMALWLQNPSLSFVHYYMQSRTCIVFDMRILSCASLIPF